MIQKPYIGNLSKMAISAAILLACFPGVSRAQQSGQNTYASVEEASKALVNAAEKNDLARLEEARTWRELSLSTDFESEVPLAGGTK